MNIDDRVAFQVRSQVSNQVWGEIEDLASKINEETWYQDARLALWNSSYVVRHFVEDRLLEKTKNSR